MQRLLYEDIAGEQKDPDDLFSCSHNTLQRLANKHCTVFVAHSETAGQDAVYSHSVEGGMRKLRSLQPSQVVEGGLLSRQ